MNIELNEEDMKSMIEINFMLFGEEIGTAISIVQAVILAPMLDYRSK